MNAVRRLRLYWLDPSSLAPLGYGVGVTAYDEGDARQLAANIMIETGFVEAAAVLAGLKIKRIFTLDDLDPGHVRFNIGNHLKRGVWFPMLKSDGWNG